MSAREQIHASLYEFFSAPHRVVHFNNATIGDDKMIPYCETSYVAGEQYTNDIHDVTCEHCRRELGVA